MKAKGRTEGENKEKEAKAKEGRKKEIKKRRTSAYSNDEGIGDQREEGKD